MLDKDIIRRRLETGITYTEFSYTILQALDFKYLHDHKNVNLQCAGSDQWGNITSGIDLIRKSSKDEGNAIWLDKNKTSSYKLYQFFINVEDSMVIDYLKIYTFLSKEQIEEYEKENNEHPELRAAHKALAREIITFLHGKEEYEKAVNLADHLFGSEDIKEVTPNQTIVDMLVEMKAVSSKREAKEFVTNGAISVNGEKINDISEIIDESKFIENTYIVVKRGKKNYYIGKKK